MRKSMWPNFFVSLIVIFSTVVTAHAADDQKEAQEVAKKKVAAAKADRSKIPMKKMKGPPNPVERGSCEFVACVDEVKKQ